MPKFVYCSECGTKLKVTRKAIKNYGRIIDLIDSHECPEEPLELDLTPTEIPTLEGQEEPERKFVQKINDLSHKTIHGAVSTMDLRDRRAEEDVKSTAPSSLIDNIKSLTNTTPAKDPGEEPNNE